MQLLVTRASRRRRAPWIQAVPGVFIKRGVRRTLCFLCALFLLCEPLPASAAPVDYDAEAQARKLLPVETNDVDNWPMGPAIGAESAILMDADTGTILYAKDIYRSEYPASITKILTTLIAVEESAMNETVVMSRSAVFSVPGDGSKIGINVNQSLSMEQALYAILVGSANEVANGVAEHISGSMSAFCDRMNERAAELGCVNSHFTNTNGLPDDAHYTCAYDMALIAQKFFSYELLCKMSSTPTYYIPPSETRQTDFSIRSLNNLYAGRRYEYAYLVGSKTGYTNSARQTLVSCAERDGMRLICVILKEESPYQFEDTIALFDYGFSNFRKVNVSQNETIYSIDSTDFFETTIDIFGSSKSILWLDQDASVILPITAEFEDLDCELSYDSGDTNNVAVLSYSYHGLPVGTASIHTDLAIVEPFSFDKVPSVEELGGQLPIPTPPPTPTPVLEEEESTVIFVNVKRILVIVVITAIVVAVILYIASYIQNYHFSTAKKSRRRRQRRRSRRTGTSPTMNDISMKDIPIKDTPMRLNFKTRRQGLLARWRKRK